MIDHIIANIRNDLLGILDENQMKLLSEVLAKHLLPLQSATTESKNEKSDMLPVFIAAKRVEGCSEKSLRYYESTIRNMLESIGKPECQITTENLRSYLDTYQRRGTVSKVTLDNVRRILSSFFAWKSGTAECWCRRTVSAALNNAWGSLYTSGSLTALNISFPFTFAEVPIVTVSLSCTGVGAFIMVPGSSPGTSTSSTGVYEIARANALSGSYSFVVNFYAIGKA